MRVCIQWRWHLLIILVTLVAQGNTQNGFWGSQYASGYQTSSTPFIIPISGANTWAVGTVKAYALTTSACSKYYLVLTKGANFFQATVTNPNICNYPPVYCPPPHYNLPGCQTLSYSGWDWYAFVYPFQLEWWDTSTTAEVILPTRQNVPVGMVPESTSFTITEALDTSIATSSMELHLTILPRQTNLITLQIEGWYSNIPSAPAAFYMDYSNLFPRAGASGHIGMQFWVYAQYDIYNGVTTMQNWFRRSQPTPQFYFKIQWGNGCNVYNYDDDAPINDCGYYNVIYYYPTGTRSWINEVTQCPSYICMDYSDAWLYYVYSTLAWEFYEDFRQYTNNVTLSFASVADVVFQYPYSMTVATVGNISLPLMISWSNLTDITDCCSPSAIAAAQSSFIGVYVVPPFPVQDLWITVYDESGNLLLTDVNKRVPYKSSPGDPGLAGWALALSNITYSSRTMLVTVRWNRRNAIGTTQEEIRASLLGSFVTDNGGSVAGLIAPIPQTISSEPGIMGAVTAQPFAAGQWMANISNQSCLTGSMMSALWTNRLQYKLNQSSTFNTYFYNSTQLYLKEQILMTITLLAGLPSAIDGSTVFWTILSAFYPVQPTMLPQFWEPSMMQRLLSFTEIPTFCSYDLGNWTYEYNTIVAAWPWFGVQVSSLQYLSIRAHVRRSIIAGPGGEAFLPPYIHLLRQNSGSGPAYNTQIVFEPTTMTVQLYASVAMPQFTEVFPDLGASNYYKQQFLLMYGGVPSTALDAGTVPGYDGYLNYTRASRVVMVNEWMLWYNETYVEALGQAISVISSKLSNLPTVVNGLGATPNQVQMATTLLASEQSVLSWQLNDANIEYAALT